MELLLVKERITCKEGLGEAVVILAKVVVLLGEEVVLGITTILYYRAPGPAGHDT